MQRKPTIVVYGDVFTDVYITTTQNRKNPETDCPLFDEYCKREFPGGAANLALNIAKLRPRFDVVMISPRKVEKVVVESLLKAGVVTKVLCGKDALPIIKKTRIMVNEGGYVKNVCRIDSEKIPNRPVFNGVGELHSILDSLDNRTSRVAAIVISDYSKGSITTGRKAPDFSYSPMLTKLCEAAQNSFAPVILDAKSSWWEHDDCITAVLPNRIEWEEANSTPDKLSSQYPERFFIETLGPNGMNIWKDGEKHHFDAFYVSSPDVAGAGDSVTAAFTVKYVDWKMGEQDKSSFIRDAGDYMMVVGAISVSNKFTYAPSYIDVDNFEESLNGKKENLIKRN